MAETAETITTAKITNYELELIKPPDWWDVDVDGKEYNVWTKSDGGRTFEIDTIEHDGETLKGFLQDADLPAGVEDAIHAAIAAEIEMLNLDMLSWIVNALVRDMNNARKHGAATLLNRYREMSFDELRKVREQLGQGQEGDR